jgi:hypothetical protein
VFAEGPLFLWTVDAQTEPELLVDDHRFARMSRIDGSNLRFATGSLRTGTSATSGINAGSERLQIPNQPIEIRADGLPKNIVVDLRVRMDQSIPHIYDF